MCGMYDETYQLHYSRRALRGDRETERYGFAKQIHSLSFGEGFEGRKMKRRRVLKTGRSRNAEGISKELLIKLYIQEKMTIQKIANSLGCSYETVRGRMKRYNVPSKHTGHPAWNKGKQLTEEMKRKLSEAHRGKHLSEETRRKISESNKEHVPWNKGKHLSEEHRKKIGEAHKGEKHYHYGEHHSEETKRKISEAHKGKHHSEDTKRKMSKIMRKRWENGDCNTLNLPRGENHPFWKGGVSFEPYGKEFNGILKEKIRERDNYTCQLCGKHQDRLGEKLSIHHIDENKENGGFDNLVGLCRFCHINLHHGNLVLRGE